MELLTFLIFLVVSFVCLLFTFSRAGYIGALVGLLIMIYKKSRFMFFVFVFFILLISSTIVLQFATAKGTASAFSRAQVMLTGYDMIVNNGLSKFIWGYGVVNSREVFIQELGSSYDVTREETGPHNFILTLGIQFGMLLTTLVCVYIFILLTRTFLSIKRNIEQGNYYKVVLSVSIVIGILIECQLEDIVVYPEFFVMPMFLIFLGYLNTTLDDRKLAN